MIISEENDAPLDAFTSLLNESKERLNRAAADQPQIYRKQTAQKLEPVVRDVMLDVARGTDFEDKIILVSGHTFPDIVALVNEHKNFGVEVKSTTQDHWHSFGNSVLESLRYENVERIFLMFGKLGGKNIEFRMRPYEDCLSEVTVTHYPRYHIDMELPSGKTIFDKINSTYDEVRQLDNPVKPFADYYRKQLKEGESLWWLGDNEVEQQEQNIKVRLWRTLNHEDKANLVASAFAWFPDVITQKGGKKYERYVLWLVTEHGIVVPNARDEFSAGGRTTLQANGHIYENVPQVFARIYYLRDRVAKTIYNASDESIWLYWKVKYLPRKKRLKCWIELVSQNMNVDFVNSFSYKTSDLLTDIFADT